MYQLYHRKKVWRARVPKMTHKNPFCVSLLCKQSIKRRIRTSITRKPQSGNMVHITPLTAHQSRSQLEHHHLVGPSHSIRNKLPILMTSNLTFSFFLLLNLILSCTRCYY